MSSLSPGSRVINGRYEVVRALGQGAFGEVYEVYDHNLSLRGALKFLSNPSPVGHPWAESRLLMALDGPYVLHVQNADVAAGQQFIVTDLAEDGAIADKIVPNVGLPVEQARLWARDIISGVQRVHQQGLLHCDIKPENVFLTSGGRAVVGDLGLAQAQDANGFAIAAGSAPTMAPEVAAASAGGPAQVYSSSSDIYSVGATLYWMLAGRPVLPSVTKPSDIGGMAIPDLWDVAPHVPPPIRTAVMTAVARDPADRFASISEFDTAISGVAVPVRRWDRVSPHHGHNACFQGVAKTSMIRLCVSSASRPGRLQISAVYASGRRIPALSKEVPTAQLPRAVRSAIRQSGRLR